MKNVLTIYIGTEEARKKAQWDKLGEKRASPSGIADIKNAMTCLPLPGQ